VSYGIFYKGYTENDMDKNGSNEGFREDDWITFDGEDTIMPHVSENNDWDMFNDADFISPTELPDHLETNNEIEPDYDIEDTAFQTAIDSNEEIWEDWEVSDNEISQEITFPETFEERLQEYDPQTNIDQSGLALVKKLYAENENIFKTLNRFLLQPKYTENFSFHQISRIACDKAFQDRLLSLDDTRYKLFTECRKIATTHEENWITSTNTILNGLLNPRFAELVQNATNTYDADLAKLKVVLNSDDNYFGINTTEQLNNYHKIKKSVCDQILIEPENEKGLTDTLKRMSPLDRIKFARCEQEYGISLSQAKLLCQKYGWAILNSDEKIGNQQNHAMLEGLTKLITAQRTEDVLNVKLEPCEDKTHTFDELDNRFKRSFVEMYNRAFYHPRISDQIGTEVVNGKQIPIYDAGVKFAMCSHVVGAFSQSDEENTNYKEKWNIPQRQNHVFCTRFIANDALEIAKENSICYGFTDFDKDAIITSAPWDMASIKFNTMFDTAGEMDKNKSMSNCEGSGARFLSPQDQINNTRKQGNETNWDRFDNLGHRKQPSYLIYIADSLENPEYKNSQTYKETLNAASQFNIPIIMIDRRKIINNEHNQIDKMIGDYAQTHNPNILKHIIQKFENNRTTGFGQSCEDMYIKEFPLLATEDKKFKSLQEIAYDLLEKNPKHAQEMVDALSMEAVKDHNSHQQFCEIIYGIKDKYPAVNIDLNQHLTNQWGITQRKTSPKKIGCYLYESFYYKKEEENSLMSNRRPEIGNRLSETRERLKERQPDGTVAENVISEPLQAQSLLSQLRGISDREISSPQAPHKTETVSTPKTCNSR